jgi:acetoin utilization deacetylase AcuC-like enzyme
MCHIYDLTSQKTHTQAYETRILPALQKFRPELLLISTGFDAHEDDPLGELELTPEDFHWVTRR